MRCHSHAKASAVPSKGRQKARSTSRWCTTFLRHAATWEPDGVIEAMDNWAPTRTFGWECSGIPRSVRTRGSFEALVAAATERCGGGAPASGGR